jgi:hypothetical protein
MARTDNSGPTDRTTPCDVCGGGTYTFASGSVWCPSEDPHPGGHFVKRVAFERAPTAVVRAKPGSGTVPASTYTKPDGTVGSKRPGFKPEPKVEDDFNVGYDAFVESK